MVGISKNQSRQRGPGMSLDIDPGEGALLEAGDQRKAL